MAFTAQFDEIANVYDETRRPLDKQTLSGINEMLSKHGCHSILEIGVGTGRIAVPLHSSGFEITGMDISRRMMQRARAKGITNLVLAEGSRAPFKDKSFDATLMAHVFHLLKDPMSVLHESARLSDMGVFALVRKRPPGASSWLSSFYGGSINGASQSDGAAESPEEAARRMRLLEERREHFRVLAAKYGWKWDPAQRARNWAWEQKILESHPPDDLKVVSDVIIEETIEDRISRFEKGGFSSLYHMPDEMRKEIIREMRSYASSHPELLSPQQRHEVYQFAMWRSDSLQD